MIWRQPKAEVPPMFRTPALRSPLPPLIRTGRQHRARATIVTALSNLRRTEQERNRFMAEGTVAADELRLLIERIERLSEEKQAMTDDIGDVYREAKSRGYHAPTMRKIVALRKMETPERQEADALLETYREALGMGSGGSGYSRAPARQTKVPTPLEEAADKVAEAVNNGALGEGVTAEVVRH